MWRWLNDDPAGRIVFSYVKVFVAVWIGLFIADGADPFAVTASDLRAWLAAALAAVLPVLVNYLNPSYGRYGPSKGDQE